MVAPQLDTTYDPKQFEQQIYCSTQSLFYPDDTKGPAYTILMPPPNVTGRLHVGHALTYTIQDILIRYYRQSGCNTLWQPGVDHAGIATQLVVTKELEAEGIDIKSLTRDELIDKIWEWKEKSGSTIVEQQKTLGCSVPWSLSRFTMDDRFSSAVTKVFVTLYKEGLIFRDKRLVNWDTKLKTAISDLEIQNREEVGTLWHIRYKIANSDEYVAVATTRPETMFGDVAVAVHPDDSRHQHLIGLHVAIPYTDRTIPIIADNYVDIEKGTGCLKVTPAHDYNDFAIGRRHGLDAISVIDKDGHMACKNVPDFLKGVYLKKARKILIEKLTGDGLLAGDEKITHTIPYGDRSGTVIEPLLTDQWFIDAKTLAQEAIEVVERGDIKFYPEKWVNTYLEWMRNIEPWCVSRQIVWGHQIPAWYSPDGKIFVEEDEETAAVRAEEYGISRTHLIRETDVLDTWFSSALWPFVTLGWPEETPALRMYYSTSVLVTGFDIIFFWVARMVMMSLHFMKEIPFRDVYVHALIRDSEGQKMSKSKGNVINPQDLMEEYGADALRFTLAFMSVPGRDIKLGKDNVKISRNFITKIWNAARFLQFKGVQFCADERVEVSGKINNWLVAKLQKFRETVSRDVRDYRFDYATRNIQSFLRDTFCDFYVETMKLHEDEDTKAIAGKVFAEFLRIAHPFIPFVTDYLAQALGIGDSLILRGPESDILRTTSSSDDEAEVDQFVELLHNARSAKQSGEGDGDEYRTLREKLHNWPGELGRVATGIV
ncbi:MAG: valine--tRNA ligase [Holosporales bacterium]|jgi:valyl-tRNA synthetase|nr:valine--tRNA ligase [Holosporales bacterium]